MVCFYILEVGVDGFEATYVLVVTWVNMAPYSHCDWVAWREIMEQTYSYDYDYVDEEERDNCVERATTVAVSPTILWSNRNLFFDGNRLLSRSCSTTTCAIFYNNIK